MITKASLAKALKPAGVSYETAVSCIDIVIETIARGLAQGETTELRGFGSFGVKGAAEHRTGINGRVTIPAHGRITFRPSRKLRDAAWNCKGT